MFSTHASFSSKARELPEVCSDDDASSKATRLLLSGSRGFGGVCLLSSAGLMSVNVFDLEEDDEDENEEADGSVDE